MKILVTGATGFIGNHLVHKLQADHEVFAITRSRPPRDKSDKLIWIEQNLGQPLDYSRLPQSVDVVIHLAQSKFYKDFPEQAKDIFSVNVNSTFNLLEYARRVGAERFIFASTGGIYGYSYEKFVETDPVSPLNFYLSSKYIAELLIANYQQFFHTTVFRLFFVYGIGQPQTMLIPRLVHSVLLGKPVMLQGHEGIQINPVHVADVVSAFQTALELTGNNLINLGGPQVLSLRQICQMIGEQLKREPLFEIRGEPEPGHLIGDVTKARALVGGPQVSFFEGIIEVCSAVEAEVPAGE